MEMLLIFLLGVGVGFVGHMAWLAWRIAQAMREIPELAKLVEAMSDTDKGSEDKTEAAASQVRLRLEHNGGVYYAFTEETDTFVGQGSTLDELQQRINQRYPGQDARVVGGDEAALSWLREQLAQQPK